MLPDCIPSGNSIPTLQVWWPVSPSVSFLPLIYPLIPCSGGALVLSVVGLRLLRGSFGELSRQHIIFIFTLLFFNFDYEHYSESLPLDYFVISLLFYKVGRCSEGVWLWVCLKLWCSLCFVVLRLVAQSSFYCHLHFTLAIFMGISCSFGSATFTDTSYPLICAILSIRCGVGCVVFLDSSTRCTTNILHDANGITVQCSSEPHCGQHPLYHILCKTCEVLGEKL